MRCNWTPWTPFPMHTRWWGAVFSSYTTSLLYRLFWISKFNIYDRVRGTLSFVITESAGLLQHRCTACNEITLTYILAFNPYRSGGLPCVVVRSAFRAGTIRQYVVYFLREPSFVLQYHTECPVRVYLTQDEQIIGSIKKIWSW